MKTRFDKKGYSLVEILVVVVILGLINGFAMVLTGDVLNTNQNISNKSDYLINLSLIQNLTLKPDKCSCQFAGKTFDSSNSEEKLFINELRDGCSPDSNLLATSAPANVAESALKVREIYIDSFSYTGKPNEYNAKLNITDFKSSGRPIPLIIRFNTVPGSSTIKTINGCGSPPLTAPERISATNSDRSCEVTWDVSVGARPIRYYVKYSTESGHVDNGTLACGPYTTTNSCSITGLTNGTTYYIVVQAKNEYETSEYTYETSCKPGTFPEPPVDMTTERGDRQCTITWSAPPDETLPITYKIYKSSAPGSDTSGVQVCSTSSTTCTVTGLTNGQTYFFSGTSTNSLGTGVFSSPEVVCEPNSPPNPPDLDRVEAYDRYCSLHWFPSTRGLEPIKYTVYDEDSGAPVPGCQNLSRSIQMCSISGLINGRRYSYSIKATNGIGSAVSNSRSCTPTN